MSPSFSESRLYTFLFETGNSCLTLFSKMSLFYFLFLLFLSINNQNLIQGSKLNVRRVLLPYNIGIPTNFTLEVKDGGCYQWSSSRLDVALIEPIFSSTSSSSFLSSSSSLNNEVHPFKSCSTKAKVTVVSHSPKRLSSIVIAKEVNSGVSNRVDIEVDVIKTIEILTTTKEIALDDVPEIINIQARNDEYDTFSSLGGIEFEWILEPIAAEHSHAMNNLR
jgi:hypothetical protein